MAKKRIIMGIVIIAVLSGILVIHSYAQYILVWRANPYINVDGIKLMMTEDKVKSVLGKEEEYIPGFGGYILNYQSQGIILTFLDDIDTDFYRKVNRIEITNAEYEIFNVKVGDEYGKALDNIRKQGFAKQKEGFSGYWMMNMYIIVDKYNDKVGSMTIGVNDRVSSTRVY